ncbi:DoxX family protein [Catenulispora acidiphila DSM 44928]|uniref:DoxX family protein n=1 Tax=Catenulispora acidiphila (strain DSM 44928 / JCM 14897 / NBRC 102108 / NRRL B-24433 / ID139908) TaxID=479433 RepID=C7PYY8_CATAD|nr:DoxX family protein [Catenulispora acidiphila]ACU69544.1 DoxX family protein [Catenulispora acidiphila DSM 44928]
MNAFLWVVQALLAALFLLSGSLKSTWPKDRLIASGQTGVTPFPLPLLRFAAVCELFAAAGLILPRAAGIAPVLTPIAAVGLCCVMAGAISSHCYLLRRDVAAGRGRREAVNVVATTVILGMCVLVAVGRS